MKRKVRNRQLEIESGIGRQMETDFDGWDQVLSVVLALDQVSQVSGGLTES